MTWSTFGMTWGTLGMAWGRLCDDLRGLWGHLVDLWSRKRARGAPGGPCFRAFSTQDENEVTLFSELVSGSLFVTFFRLFLENLGGRNSVRRPFGAKTCWYLDALSFFSLGPFLGKVRFSNFRDPEKEHPGAPGRHHSSSIPTGILKF